MVGRTCNDCGIQITEDNVIGGSKKLLKCRPCYDDYMVTKSADNKRERRYWDCEFGAPLYGPGQMRHKVGEYYNDKQEEYVTDILKAIGWKKSDKGVWYKKGIKDEDGTFTCFTPIPEGQVGKKSTKYRLYFQKHPEDIPILKRSKRNFKHVEDQEIVRDIQLQFFLENQTRSSLAKRYGVTIKYVTWILESTYRRFKIESKK